MKNLARNAATGRIYEHYQGMIKRFLLVNLRSREDAEDLLQETFVRFQKHQATVDLESSKNFLFTIARNLMIDKLRHQKVSVVDTEWEIDELLDPLSCVERQAVVKQDFEVLHDAIKDLPPQCRRVFIMRKIYHLSHKEIAGNLGLSVSTVEKHLATGLERCQNYIEKRRENR